MKAIWGSLIVLEVSEVNIPQKRELNVCFFSLMKYLWYLSLSYTSKENLSHLCHSTLYRESSDSWYIYQYLCYRESLYITICR